MNLIFDRPKGNTDLQDYDYTSLDEQATQDLVRSVCMLMDRVFDTENDDFGRYLSDNPQEAQTDPAKLFDKMFAALNDHALSKPQQAFVDVCRTNVGAIFRWYKKNGACVNVSPKQRAWFERWFTRNAVPCPTWAKTPKTGPKIRLKGLA